MQIFVGTKEAGFDHNHHHLNQSYIVILSQPPPPHFFLGYFILQEYSPHQWSTSCIATKLLLIAA